MSRRVANLLAWSSWTLSVALVPIGFILGVFALPATLPPGREPILPLIAVMDVLILAYGTVGALIASRRPGNAVG